MKRVCALIGLVVVLGMVPGADRPANAAFAPPAPPAPSSDLQQQSSRPRGNGSVSTRAFPTTTVGKFGTSFVVGSLPQGLRQQAVNLANEAGLAWSREDLNWASIESVQGVYNYADRDHAINMLSQNGAKIVGNLVYTPQFYSSNPGAPNFSTFAPTSAAGLNAWQAFVTATVNRYKDRIQFWQVWHSTQDPAVWNIVPGQPEYFALMQRAYPAMKAADPNATMIMAAALPSWLNPFLDLGGAQFFDAFAMTNYSTFDNPASPTTPIPEGSQLTASRLALAKDLARRRAPTKPIYVTEYDFASQPPARAPIGEEDQAAYQIRSLLLQEAQGNVAGVFWGFYFDNPGINFGMLLRGDLSKKLSFNAYKAMTTALAGATFTEQKPSPSTATQVIDNFEGAQGYIVNPFGTGSGSFTQTTAQARTGTRSGQINFAWTTPGGSGVNVQPLPALTLPITGSPSRISFWAKGDGGPAVHLGFSFTDATNRFCSGFVGAVGGTEWKQYTLYFDTQNGKTSMVTCAGVDGIVPNFPIVLNGYQISGTAEASQTANGVIYLDDITAESGPSIFDLVYTAGTTTIHAIWSLQGNPTFSLPTTATSVTTRDWQNVTGTLNAANGAVQVPVSYHPIFVTIAPAQAANCTDRPRVTIATAKNGVGGIVATIRSNTSTTVAANQIQSIQVLAATNASIDLGTRTNMSGNFTEPFSAGTTVATLVLRRANGVGSAQVPLQVVDNCGVWKTFVGGGPSGF